MEININHRAENTILLMSGQLDENSQLPPITKAFANLIICDLGEVKTVNSLGIQLWVNWLKSIPPKYQLRLISCSPAIVLQFNVINNFLTSNAQVVSVMVPFFCETHQQQFVEKFTIGKDLIITNNRVEVIKNVTVCPGNQVCQVENDFSPNKYFRFLVR